MWLQKTAGFLTKFNRPLVGFVKNVAMGILATMMFLIFTAVLFRYLFNRPVSGDVELVEFMMGILVTFSVAYTAHKKSHIGVDLLLVRLKEKTRKIIGVVTSFLTLILFIFICWQTYILIGEDYHSKLESAVLYIPVYPFIIVVTIGFVILCLVLLAEFLSLLGEVISEWTRL